MIKNVKSLCARILVAVILGLILASTFTKTQGPCTSSTPGEDVAKCVEFSKAILHPNDLLNNNQDSLVNFSKTFASVSVTTFIVFGAYDYCKKHTQIQ